MTTYLFCLKKWPGEKHYRNARVPVELCQKFTCEYLTDGGSLGFGCACPASTEYFLAFKNKKKEVTQ